MRGASVANVSEADRIEFMQRRHRPARIPPFPRHARKPRDFVRIDGAGRYELAIHVTIHVAVVADRSPIHGRERYSGPRPTGPCKGPPGPRPTAAAPAAPSRI